MGEINTSYNSDTDRNGYGKEDLPGSAYSKQNFKRNKRNRKRGTRLRSRNHLLFDDLVEGLGILFVIKQFVFVAKTHEGVFRQIVFAKFNKHLTF